MKYILTLCLFFTALPAFACEDFSKSSKENAYVEAINDLPIYKGMVEVGEGATVFDSPEGRIVEVYLRGPANDMDKARAFYKKVLPTLGWRERGGKFFRNKESLEMHTELEKCETFQIKFSLKPSSKE